MTGLMRILQTDVTGAPLIKSLRPRLLAVQILCKIMPHIMKADEIDEIGESLLQFLSEMHWVPLRVITETSRGLKKISDTSTTSDPPEISSDCCWSSEKLTSCAVEEESILIHSTGGRGYGLASHSLTAGRHVWKVEILNEARGNEGTCVGVSKWPVSDYSHRTTRDMWLYRAYSGNLYHNGEIQNRSLPQFTQDDSITCILDIDARTLSFAKNNDAPIVAFEDMPMDMELFPCVTFYSSSPGEKVRITSMVMQGAQRDLGKSLLFVYGYRMKQKQFY